MSIAVCCWQAWIITTEYLSPNSHIDEQFIALIDHHIPSATVLDILNNLSHSYHLTDEQQTALPLTARYILLNDGTNWENHIICGNNPGLRARRVCNVTTTTNIEGQQNLSWREPRIIVEDEQREIAYWEECSLPILLP